MNRDSFLSRAFHLYYDGFRSMTLGKTLWLIIGIKLFIMFAILKVFFFPNFLSQHSEKGGEADFVATELTHRSTINSETSTPATQRESSPPDSPAPVPQHSSPSPTPPSP
ncbi:MAG: DUF4492 domain-containing protein [Bacteroidaceae bacterium]|nr:DUF4492 domain-containing protein [Bacteroidaceae bacterium]